MSKALILACSPRKNGNSDCLAQWAGDTARKKGYLIDIIYLRNYSFSSCLACGACNKDGICHVKDELVSIYLEILAAEKVFVAAPIFFQSLGGLAKSMIDRMQCFWAAQNVLGKNIITDTQLAQKRRLYAILCAATDLKDTFYCAEKVLRIFGKTIEAPYHGGIFIPSVDEKGAVKNSQEIKEQVIEQLEEFFSN